MRIEIPQNSVASGLCISFAALLIGTEFYIVPCRSAADGFVGALLAARQPQQKSSSYGLVGACHARDDGEMFSVILFEPEIPPNTGNIIRLCANTGAQLHLVEPLGFDLDDKKLRRAGLDYREFADVAVHASLDVCLETLGSPRVFALSTRGSTRHDAPNYAAGDAFLFGPETRGLPQAVLDNLPAGQRLRLPMRAGSRSLNLSNSAAVVVYEAWRQLGFEGGA